MEMQTAITLLTIAVILLSTVMVVLLGIIIALLVKIRTLLKQADVIVNNVARASEWLVPANALTHIVNLFRK